MRSTTYIGIVSIAVLAFLPAGASAETLFTSPTGSVSATTCPSNARCALEHAVEDLADPGDVVELGPGNYAVTQVTVVDARSRIGEGTFLNIGVMVAAADLVEIGDHCMFANGCFVTDSNHRFDDPDKPITWQGFTSKGPTRVGDNVWCGANVVVTSGVTVGERCVIGANSVVTEDIPPFSIAAGAPAKVLRRVEYDKPPPDDSS